MRSILRCLAAALSMLALVACGEDVTPRSVDAAVVDSSQEGMSPSDQGLDIPGDAAPSDVATSDVGGGETSTPDMSADVSSTTGEILLFDGKGLQFTAADKGFHALINPGDPLAVSNWSSPTNYYDGELHVRYVISAPSDQVAGKLQLCIWTMGNADGDGKNYFPESCADQVAHTGVGTYTGKSLVPAQWWTNQGVPLVFAHPERFLIRVVLRGASGCNVTSYTVSNGCWNEWPNYQNMTFRTTLVMVPQGGTFSGWGSYP